jgi:hypothetical protein
MSVAMLPALVEYVIWFVGNRGLVLGVWARSVAVVVGAQNGEICQSLLKISHLCFYVPDERLYEETYLSH